KNYSHDADNDLSYRRLEEAYRTGNLDLLDTINKVNSQSAAFDEKFLYKRNDIQAASIDSILKKGTRLFVGVGAAHLPGERGVIESLRRAGYTLRPIKMATRDSHHKDEIEKLRVPVQFSKQTSEDGFYSVSTPGKLYSFETSNGGAGMQQYADMTNGSYYMVSRIMTNAAILGQSEVQVERKLDSVLYENIPGKILSKKTIVKNGYRGFEIINRTRRGDYQHYNIFVTPFEVIIFKMSGNGDYVKLGTEAARFFNSIQLKEYSTASGVAGWRKYKPAGGGFEVEFPHHPLIFNDDNRRYAAYDASTKTAFEVIRTDVHNYGFVEEDSFDLSLMEESFAASEFISKQRSQNFTNVGGYPALDVTYRCKDSSIALVRFIISGPRYYTLITRAANENRQMKSFITSFAVKPFTYNTATVETDTAMHFSVTTAVPLEKKKKLEMYPEGASNDGDDDDSLIDNGKFMDRVIVADTTGEKIYVSFYKPSQYYQHPADVDDSTLFKKAWVVRYKKRDTLADNSIVIDYLLGSESSSRAIKGKIFTRNGSRYKLETELDTLSAPSTFITSFFQTFTLLDTAKGVDVKKKKPALFFTQFFSADTMQHRAAIKNIGNVMMDPSDYPQLKKAIEALSWREKKYVDVKKQFISHLSSMPAKEVSDFLKRIYYAAGDTVELQYTALETLLQQATSYSYKTFAGIMEADPPVLHFKPTTTTVYSRYNDVGRYDDFDDEYSFGYKNGSFLDDLTDTLQLTAGIFKNLLPLVLINDYEQPIMNLTGALLDSNIISAKEYEAYLPKFIIEAKQELKKQSIQEKSKAIEKAAEDDSDKKPYNSYSRSDKDYGNSKLSLYATLLLPFWDKNPQIPQMIAQMFSSTDNRLKYNTTLLLLRNKRRVPDTLFTYFARMDDYRYQLFADLKKLDQLSLFPASFKNKIAIASSRLLSEQSYTKLDTVVFIKKVPLQYKDRDGYIYVFKVKEKREDNSWKLATVGLLPKDDSAFWYENAGDMEEEQVYDFTDITTIRLTSETPEKEQIDSLIKRLLYSKRKSAARFYNEDNRYNDAEFSRVR
ncbi:MAG TPA: TraB/GumN family protein, partial [Flavisolibacter sp.]|nr:TraB/GumN family protein [Flavisolibacter sp.]